METFLDIVPAIAGIAFIGWLLRELVLSQKSKESVPVVEPVMTLVVFVQVGDDPPMRLGSVNVQTLKEAQQHLNLYMFDVVKRAYVYHNARVCYEMNKAGVLEAV